MQALRGGAVLRGRLFQGHDVRAGLLYPYPYPYPYPYSYPYPYPYPYP